jgi:hypothetical protein
MVTNNYDFKTVTRLRMLCMKVLPTVYGDALSYEEQVCKVTEKINQLVDTVNALPDYIVEVVKELNDAAGLEDIVKNVLADLYFINVKNPPAPFIAAKGDGATNDTEAIQALLNYAGLQRSYLFFPAGNYIVTGLTMVENVSLVGLDRYSSIITLAPDSNRDLVTGFVENASISNLTLNANMNAQTANCSCLNATVDNALIDFVIFRNGYDSVVIENTNEFEGAYWLFDGIQHNALTLNGDGAVISNVIFKNASQLSANALAIVNGNNKITGIFSNVAIPNGVVISAAGATVEGTIINARTTITGGNGNYVNVEDLTGLTKYGTNDTETLTGNKTTNAATATETYTGNKTTNATNDTENITTKTINATDISLNPINPLTYKTPTTSEALPYFDTIPFKDKNNTPYNVLVENSNTNKLTEDVGEIKRKFGGKKILILGDSLSWEDPTGTVTWVKRFRDVVGPLASKIDNLSYGGYTSSDILEKVNSLTETYDIIIVWCGINDCTSGIEIGYVNGANPGTFAYNMINIIGNLQAKNLYSEIYCLGFMTQSTPWFTENITVHNPRYYNQIIYNACVILGAAYIDMASNMFGHRSYQNLIWTTDGLHPIKEMQNIMGDKIISSMLKEGDSTPSPVPVCLHYDGTTKICPYFTVASANFVVVSCYITFYGNGEVDFHIQGQLNGAPAGELKILTLKDHLGPVISITPVSYINGLIFNFFDTGVAVNVPTFEATAPDYFVNFGLHFKSSNSIFYFKE